MNGGVLEILGWGWKRGGGEGGARGEGGGGRGERGGGRGEGRRAGMLTMSVINTAKTTVGNQKVILFIRHW